MSKLVIVESPAKAKTIKKYLGKDYDVTASMGHVRDLPEKRLGVDIENDFSPVYVNVTGKKDLLKSLKEKASKSDIVYLATDPDREGEAISWHLSQLLKLDDTAPIRVSFNEITKKAVTSAIQDPRPINGDLVNAQQARRILDRLVGYKLSPFLWKKIKRGLSAGRVQSVATRLVVDREREITAFNPEEYWNLSVELFNTANNSFTAKFHGDKKKKIELKSGDAVKTVLDSIKNGEFIVAKITEGTKKRNPSPPFITSSLQQEASRRYSMSSRNTMRIAQSLYEGVNIGKQGLTGLITYMRTDSLRISDDARDAAKEFITTTYGSEFYPETPRVFKTKSTAQDAHEAIRPSFPEITPDSIKEKLNPEQYKIYKIIWERFLASQMETAIYETISVDIENSGYIFKANDQKVKFQGFTVLYEDYLEENEQEKFEKIPTLEKDEKLKSGKINSEQKFTLPPARYTEASLIKALEENGIGRPSTYAPTISTITDRGYVEKESKSLLPTELGFITTDVMTEYFSDIVNVEFTAGMEKKLDEVENNNEKYTKMLADFYHPFAQNLLDVEKKLENKDFKIKDEESDILCENCGKNMVIKQGRFGKFLACPGFPECKNTKSIDIPSDGECPKCSSKILVRKSKKGKRYFGCEKNPGCDFMTWNTPLKENCPQCNSTLFKKPFGGGFVCEKDGCGYTKEIEKKKKESEK